MKKKTGILIAGAVVLVLLAAGLWYTRPVRLTELCPPLEGGTIREITGTFIAQEVRADGKVNSIPTSLVLDEDGPALAEVLEVLKEQRCRRRLLGLLPWAEGAGQAAMDAYDWYLMASGVSIFADERGLCITMDGTDTVFCRAGDQAALVREVYDILDRTWQENR